MIAALQAGNKPPPSKRRYKQPPHNPHENPNAHGNNPHKPPCNTGEPPIKKSQTKEQMIDLFVPKLLAALTPHLQKAATQPAALLPQQQQTVAQAQLAIQQGNANKPFQNYPTAFINIETDERI